MPHSGSWRNKAEHKSCAWIVNGYGICQNRHPGLVSHYFFLILHFPTTNKSQVLQISPPLGAVICRWVDSKAGSGGKRCSTGRPAGSQDFSNISQPIVSTVLVCTRLAVAVQERPGSQECDLIQRGQTLQVLWGPIRWHVLLNSLRLRTIQLWAPRLLRLRICDSSPGHQVPRGIQQLFHFIWKINVYFLLVCSWFPMLSLLQRSSNLFQAYLGEYPVFGGACSYRTLQSVE